MIISVSAKIVGVRTTEYQGKSFTQLGFIPDDEFICYSSSVPMDLDKSMIPAPDSHVTLHLNYRVFNAKPHFTLIGYSK